MHSCIVLQPLQYHSNLVSLSFRCRFIPRDTTKFLRRNDPKKKISLVAGSFHFRTRRNDTRSSFEGTTGTQPERPTVFGEGGPNGGEGRPNDGQPPALPVLVPVIPISFLVRGSFRIVREGKDVLERRPNEVGTRKAGGQKWEYFPPWHYQPVLSWYLHQPESHQLSLHKRYSLTDIRTQLSDPGSDKNLQRCVTQFGKIQLRWLAAGRLAEHYLPAHQKEPFF